MKIHFRQPSHKPPVSVTTSASSCSHSNPAPQLYKSNNTSQSPFSLATSNDRPNPLHTITTNQTHQQPTIEALNCDQPMRPTYLPLSVVIDSRQFSLLPMTPTSHANNRASTLEIPKAHLQTCPVEPSEAFKRLNTNQFDRPPISNPNLPDER